MLRARKPTKFGYFAAKLSKHFAHCVNVWNSEFGNKKYTTTLLTKDYLWYSQCPLISNKTFLKGAPEFPLKLSNFRVLKICLFGVFPILYNGQI